MHVVVLGVLAAYTLLLLLLVARNVHALRTHHACADVSAPLARTLAAMLDAPKQREAAVEALRGAPLRAVRVAVFGADGDVVLDTHEGARGARRPRTSARCWPRRSGRRRGWCTRGGRCWRTRRAPARGRRGGGDRGARAVT